MARAEATSAADNFFMSFLQGCPGAPTRGRLDISCAGQIKPSAQLQGSYALGTPVKTLRQVSGSKTRVGRSRMQISFRAMPTLKNPGAQLGYTMAKSKCAR